MLKIDQTPIAKAKNHIRNFSCPILKSTNHTSLDKTSESSEAPPTLTKLRKRKSNNFQPIQPETVAKVVKSYVLPMIRYKCSSQFEHSSLVSHLSLIESLQHENDQLTSQVSELQEREKFFIQERFGFLEEINRVKAVNLDLQTQVRFLHSSMTQTMKSTRRIEKQLEYSKSHKTRSQVLVEEYEKQFKCALEELQIQRDLNNIRLRF